jgi:hypothetical protein
MVNTIDIIKDLVTNLDLKLNVTSVVTVGTTYKLFTCNTYYLAPQSKVTINAVVYTVVSIVNNEYIIVSGASLPSKGVYSLPAPYFTHGTVKQANEELSMESDMFKKTPMVFLRRPFSEVFYNGQQSDERNVDLTLYFLTQADFEHWQIDSFDANAIKPMYNLMNAFINMLNNNKYINKANISEFRIEEKIKFGIYVNDKGYENSIFNDTLSGVQLSLSLPIRKNYTCTC